MKLSNADPLLGAAWHAVGEIAEIGGVSHPVWLLGRRWRLWREAGSGELQARDDEGAAPARLAERHGLVWLAPDPPQAEFPDVAAHEDAGFATRILTRTTKVSAGVLTDNFLDVSHFSYLHPTTFGRVAPVTTAGYSVERRGWLLELTHATDLHEGAGDHLADPRHSPTWRRAVYTVVAPFTTHLAMEFPVTGARSAATLVCQPETEDRTTVRVLVAWPADDPAGLAEQMSLSADVLAEDLSILELMADPRLELSLRAELHTRADRASVEYRRLIAEQLETARLSAPAPV